LPAPLVPASPPARTEQSPTGAGSAAAIRRAIQHEIAEAERQLGDAEKPLALRVHLARKCLKRARSLVGVLRPVLGKGHVLAKALRQAAGDLSAARDADVVRQTAQHDAGLELLAADSKPAGQLHLDRVAEALKAASGSAEHLAIRGEADWLIGEAVDHAYRRGRKAMRHALDDHRVGHFHAWRKATKRLASLLDFSAETPFRRVKRLTRRLDRLGGTLGDHRDLDLLRSQLAEKDSLSAEVEKAIASRQSKLRSKAAKIGADLYAMKPRAFRKAIGAPGPSEAGAAARA